MVELWVISLQFIPNSQAQGIGQALWKIRADSIRTEIVNVRLKTCLVRKQSPNIFSKDMLVKSMPSLRKIYWLMLMIQLPDHVPEPAGILLVDTTDDSLHIKLRTGLQTLDEDIQMFWGELPEFFETLAQDLGGLGVIEELLGRASLFLQVSSQKEMYITRPSACLDILFERYASKSSSSFLDTSPLGVKPTRSPTRVYDLPVGIPPNLMMVLNQKLVNLQSNPAEIADILARDPAVSAHVVRTANSALYYSAGATRTLREAVLRLGFDQIRFHVIGSKVKEFFGTRPEIQEIWNHSIKVSQLSRSVSRFIAFEAVEELMLVALLHDLGRAALRATDPRISEWIGAQDRNDLILDTERRLYGVTHPEVGADLLERWSLPHDLTEAIRHHHNPNSSSPYAEVLFLLESATGLNEDRYDEVKVKRISDSLGLRPSDLALPPVLDEDLRALSFAA